MKLLLSSHKILAATATVLFFLVSACAPEATKSGNAEISEDTVVPVSIVSRGDYGASLSSINVSVSGCLSQYAYNSTSTVPVSLASLQLRLNDDTCVFTFPTSGTAAVVYNGTSYYGISGYNAISSGSPTQLRFSTTSGGSGALSLIAVSTVTGVYPATGSPAPTFTLTIPSALAGSFASGTAITLSQ
ncbi:MAG: hypothetical protein V4591_11045 [Bdellovibrionota bacterium]